MSPNTPPESLNTPGKTAASPKTTTLGGFLLRILKAIFIRKKDCCK
jgi:hypothetical protein